MTPDTISARIKHARVVAGLSPQEMREKLRNLGLKYSQGGWHRVENTEPTNPNLQLIKAISRVTGVSPGWLLFGEGDAMVADAGVAIRRQVIDAIEVMGSTLRMTKRQTDSFNRLIQSLRNSS
ncbi:MAG: hypothetical protein AAF552_02760 [Pseudomonadota bacterium]